jgi:predicted nucleic acid-binding protein
MKLVLEEPGSGDARDLFLSSTLIQSSWLLAPEANAALARARRDRRLSPGGAARALDVLSGLLGEVEMLPLDQALAERAGALAATLGLRGGDAVHLASYDLVEDEESVLVAADGDLVRAALSLGHAVAVPG